MSYNLLIWRWADEFADKNRQRQEHLTHGKVASAFMESEQHFALGSFDQEPFLKDIDSLFPGEETSKPFVVYRYPNGIIFNYSGLDRITIVPIIGGVAREHGLNATEAQGCRLSAH